MKITGWFAQKYREPIPLASFQSGELFARMAGRGFRPELVEFDRSGRRIRTFAQAGWVASRYHNGDTMVYEKKRLFEVSADERVVWEVLAEDRFVFARVIYPLVRFGTPVDGQYHGKEQSAK